MYIFGITVAWSIYTTAKKACELIAKEKLQKQGVNEKQSLLEAEGDAETKAEDNADNSPELQAIQNEEYHHFTKSRTLFTLFSFAVLFVT